MVCDVVYFDAKSGSSFESVHQIPQCGHSNKYCQYLTLSTSHCCNVFLCQWIS